MDPKPVKYLLSYKFSQHHITHFFRAVRGRGGWNNNPTARQFKAAYKRFLVHHNESAAKKILHKQHRKKRRVAVELLAVDFAMTTN